MDDILIRGGQVIDGTGAPARVADVAIRAGRIVAIEADRAESAARVIDAPGSMVARASSISPPRRRCPARSRACANICRAAPLACNSWISRLYSPTRTGSEWANRGSA
jgi:hypothetical protein